MTLPYQEMFKAIFLNDAFTTRFINQKHPIVQIALNIDKNY